MRRLIVLLALTATTLASLVQPASAAEELAPTLTFNEAWIIAKGAALEVSYTVTCPDVHNGERHALWTQLNPVSVPIRNGEYIEIDCSSAPRTITNIVAASPSTGPFGTGTMEIGSHITNCLYFDTIDEPVPGCHNVDDVSTAKLNPGKFVPESAADLLAHLTTVKTRLRGEAVEVTQVLTCEVDAFGFLFSSVTQASSSGVTRGSGGVGDGEVVDCAAGQSQTFTYSVPVRQGTSFRPGEALLQSEFSNCGECGVKAFDTSLVRLGS